MDDFGDNEIGKLLRLKRYEQPPPGYFEDFIHEFHRRQRDELLRQPLWQIAWQRAQDFMLKLNARSLASYPAMATAIVLCAAVITFKAYEPSPEKELVAKSSSAAVALPQATAISDTDAQGWDLHSPIASRDLRSPQFRDFRDDLPNERPSTTRYVLDSTPVSYEPAIRF